jgi:hypothetical protein
MPKGKAVFRNLGASNHSLRERQEEDFYKTDVKTIKALIDKLIENNMIDFDDVFIEPSVGDGVIIDTISNYTSNYVKYLAYDIVDRGFNNTKIQDFLTVESFNLEDKKMIIGNPPYKLATEFVEHSLDLLDDGEYACYLLKIQFLEGKKRRKMFEKYPPKHVWVFSERQGCLKNGEQQEHNSAVCYCWHIFQKGFVGKPTIDWL